MTLNEFAAKHRLRRLKRDECGDLNIIGRRGDLYVHGPGRFAVTIMGAPKGHWFREREALKAAGAKITQDGDQEGTATFDPHDEAQTQAALRAIRPYVKPRQSLEQRAASAARLREIQKAQAQRGVSAARNDVQVPGGNLPVLDDETRFEADKGIATGRTD